MIGNVMSGVDDYLSTLCISTLATIGFIASLALYSFEIISLEYSAQVSFLMFLAIVVDQLIIKRWKFYTKSFGQLKRVITNAPSGNVSPFSLRRP